jgi:hypothetical protein
VLRLPGDNIRENRGESFPSQLDRPRSEVRKLRGLSRARHMLVTELSISRGLAELEAIQMLQGALAKSSLSLPSPC